MSRGRIADRVEAPPGPPGPPGRGTTVQSAFGRPDPGQTWTFGPPPLASTSAVVVSLPYVALGGTLLLWASYAMDASVAIAPLPLVAIAGAVLYLDGAPIAAEEQDFYLPMSNLLIDGALMTRLVVLGGAHLLELELNAQNFTGFVDGGDPADFDCSIMVVEHLP